MAYSTFRVLIRFNMKVLFFLGCLILSLNAAPVSDQDLKEWQQFKVQYNKLYNSEGEEKNRLNIFLDNKILITKHNENFQLGKVSYKLQLNQYSDMLQDEFNEILNGFNRNQSLQKQKNELQEKRLIFIPPDNVDLPNFVNWTAKGAVTPVKDQKWCGSCWAFSSTGSLEGQHFRKTGVLVSLSEQNLIDCSSSEGNYGCYGGLMDNAFRYVETNGGIDTEKSYPYKAMQGPCRYNPNNIGTTESNLVDIPRAAEEALKAAVATVGPISVAIDAGHKSFHFYSGGVYNEPNCSNSSMFLNHAVLIVGYGTDEATQTDYWLIKNSWSETWGERGYIRMIRNHFNQCGIATSASYPVI